MAPKIHLGDVSARASDVWRRRQSRPRPLMRFVPLKRNYEGQEWESRNSCRICIEDEKRSLSPRHIEDTLDRVIAAKKSFVGSKALGHRKLPHAVSSATMVVAELSALSIWIVIWPSPAVPITTGRPKDVE